MQAKLSSTASGQDHHTPTLHLLIADDDPPVRDACTQIASKLGFAVHAAATLSAARGLLYNQTVDLLLLDLTIASNDGLRLIEQVKALHPQIVVIVMTAFATVSSAVEAMRMGADDYLTKPFALEELTAVLERSRHRRHMDLDSRRLRDQLRTRSGSGNLIGTSPEMEKLYRIVSKVAFSTHPVLILGESGTGKELVARAIHANGTHTGKPFIPVDCGSLVPTLIESELFGYVRGAFTGANRAKDGLLAAADGGTVFLDEIGELPLDLQAKLLRALQEKEIRPVGSTQTVPITARVLAATNRDLASMVAAGRFRKDLYFRLNVVNIKIPPLRTRREDIPALAAHFLDRMHRENGVDYVLSDDSLRIMSAYDWPGNVRELENAIERACALSSGPVLQLRDMPSQLQEFRMHAFRGETPDPTLHSADDADLQIVSIAEMEKEAILTTIRQLNGDKLMAARLLGIGKTTLYRKLKEYGIAETVSFGS